MVRLNSCFFIGDLVPEASWPLSRFTKGQTEVKVDFAVSGTNSEAKVS